MAEPQDKTQGTQTPEQIEAEIERTRERLGETVEALSAKADVKGRVSHRAQSVREQHATTLAAGAVGALVLVVGLVVWRRRR